MERLQKVLAQRGVASRRAAEELILQGRVTINGEVVTTLGVRVDPERDRVEFDGEAVRPPRRPTYIVLNKPRRTLTTTDDPRERPTVMGLVQPVKARVFPVGRLDWDTEGALLLTDDTAMANALLHPSGKIPKTYLVKVKGLPRPAELRALAEGVDLEDGRTAPAGVEMVRSTGLHAWLRLTLYEGRNHQVKRMCDAIDHRVLKLNRERFAGIGVEDLAPGAWRNLKPSEIKELRILVGIERSTEPVEAEPPSPPSRRGWARKKPLSPKASARKRATAAGRERDSGRTSRPEPRSTRPSSPDARARPRRPTRGAKKPRGRGETERQARPTAPRSDRGAPRPDDRRPPTTYRDFEERPPRRDRDRPDARERGRQRGRGADERRPPAGPRRDFEDRRPQRGRSADEGRPPSGPRRDFEDRRPQRGRGADERRPPAGPRRDAPDGTRQRAGRPGDRPNAGGAGRRDPVDRSHERERSRPVFGDGPPRGGGGSSGGQRKPRPDRAGPGASAGRRSAAPAPRERTGSGSGRGPARGAGKKPGSPKGGGRPTGGKAPPRKKR